MAEYNASMVLATPGPDITFNGATPTYLNNPDECEGLDQAPLRVTTEDRPRTSGGIIYPGLRGGRPITLSGVIRVSSVAARTTAENNLIAALESIETADGTLTWTPTSGAKVWTVRCMIPVSFRGNWTHYYTFTLYASNPNAS